MAFNDFVQAARDPFFSPGASRPPGTNWAGTELVSGPGGYLEQNPNALWTRYLAGQGVGLGDASAQSNWLRSQRDNAMAGFQAAMADDPTLTLQRYLGSLNFQDILSRYNRLSGQQRGENWSRSAGPSRWLSAL